MFACSSGIFPALPRQDDRQVRWDADLPSCHEPVLKSRPARPLANGMKLLSNTRKFDCGSPLVKNVGIALITLLKKQNKTQQQQPRTYPERQNKQMLCGSKERETNYTLLPIGKLCSATSWEVGGLKMHSGRTGGQMFS